MLHSRILPFPRGQGGQPAGNSRISVCLLPVAIPAVPCQGWVLVRVVGGAGSSSQAAAGRVTHYFAPGFRVTPAVTHFPRPLK